jgi:hypothetical protein
MKASIATLLPPLIRRAALIASSAFFTAAAFADPASAGDETTGRAIIGPGNVLHRAVQVPSFKP